MAIIDIKGLEGLDKVKKNSYIEGLKNAGIVDNTWTSSEIDRVYRNDQFIDRFGEDMFNSISDPETRDEMFKRAIINDELNTRFSNDKNLDTIKRMSTEGQLELLESGYLSPEELSKESLETGDLTENQKSALNKAAFNETPWEVINNTFKRSGEAGLVGFGVGATIGALGGPVGAGVLGAAGTAIGAAYGAMEGLVGGIYNRYVEPENLSDNIKVINDDILSRAIDKDVDRRRNSEEVKELSKEANAIIREQLSSGELTYDQLDKEFEGIVGKREIDGEEFFGSNYYNRFKDSYLKNIDETTKIKVISDYQALSILHPDIVYAGIDQIFQNIAADRQGVGEELWNTVTRNAIGLGNDFMQLGTGLTAEVIRHVYGDDAAVAFLEGTSKLGRLSPEYLSKAAQYNTLDPDEIAKSEQFGGLSEGVHIKKVNEPEWHPLNIANESLGQMHYLGYYGIMGKLTGGLAKKFNINPSTKLGTAYKWGATIVPNMSMSSQMGLEAYDSTKEALMEQYNSKIQESLDQLIQPELDKIDWNKELQNYKSEHIREGEQILMPDDRIINMLKEQKKADLAQDYMPIAEAANSDILNEINSQALDAFRMEAVMDLFKNSINAATFRAWMYNVNPALRNSIRNDELSIKFNRNTAVSQATKPRHLFLKSAGKEMLGEGADEFLDGITVGMSEGYNVAQFNGWLANRENPDSVDATTAAFNALAGMSMGIRNAFNEDNVYEAALGAVSPWLPLFNRGTAKPGSTKRPFITNGVYEEYVSQLDRYASVEQRVDRINEFLTKNSDQINNIAALNAPSTAAEIARKMGDEKALRDAEEQQLINAATLFNTARDVAIDADMVDQMSSTVNRLIDNNYTDEEKQQLGTEFINQPENKGKGLTPEQGYNRLRENAQKLKDTAEKLREVEDKVSKIPNIEKLSPEARRHLVVQSMQQEDWESRLNSMTKDLGIGDSHSTTLSVRDMANIDDAKFLVEELKSSHDVISKSESELQSRIDNLDHKKLAIRLDKNISLEEKKARIASIDKEIEELNQAKAQVTKEVDRRFSLFVDAQEDLNNWSDNDKVLSADEILNSSALKISYMIENKSKYSTEQRAQIDEAINRLTNKDSNYLAKLDDATKVALSIEEGNRAYVAIQESPKGYDALVRSLKEAKGKAQGHKEAIRFKNQLFMEWDKKSPNEILKDKRAYEDLVEEYRRRNKGARFNELQDIANVIKFRKDLSGLVDTGDRLTDKTIIDSIVDITSQANSKNEAITLLNRVINDKNIPHNMRENIRDILETADILDKAASITFKQEKDEIARKEKERKEDEKLIADFDAYQRAEAEKVADEEAAKRATQVQDNKGTIEDKGQEVDEEVETIADNGQEVAEEVETIQDDGREVVEEVDKIPIGREPISQVDEEVVDLFASYSSQDSPEPSTEDAVKRSLDDAEKKGNVTDTREELLEKEIKTGNAQEGELVGNAHSRYRVIDGVVKLREATEKIVGKLKAIFEWFDSTNIRFQEVIDNELNAISKLDPDVRILKVNPKDNATNDSVMRDVYMLVVEYNKDIAKIHKGKDSILEADGKEWLVIGSLGYNSKVDGQNDIFKALTYDRGSTKSPLNQRFSDFWRNNPGAKYHVDEIAYTKISRVNPGRLVRETDDKPAGTRLVSELLREGGLKLEDAKWAIADGTKLKVIGRVEDNGIMNEVGVAGKAGTLYLLIPSANGRYIASYMVPAYTDTLKEGSELRTIIEDAFTKLVSDSHKERYDGLKTLFQYIYLTKKKPDSEKENEYRISIGSETDNTLTVVVAGESHTYNLSDPTISKASIIQELFNSHFRMAIWPTTFTDAEMLNLYNEGGALLTSLQKYGTSGADFNVFEMNENGIPNIPEDRSRYIEPRGEAKPKTTITTLYNNRQYVKTSTGWRSIEGQDVTDPVMLRHLQYMEEILKGKAPYSSTSTHNQYVFDFNRDNPIVISVSKKGAKVTELSKEKAIEYLDKQAAEEEKRRKQEEVDKALEAPESKADINLDSNFELLDEQSSKGLESLLFDDDAQGTPGAQEEEKPKTAVPTPSELDPNKHNGSSERDDGFTNINEIMVNHGGRFIGIILEKIKKEEWKDFPMDDNKAMIKYLEAKGLKTTGIEDVDAWFDILEKCTK